MSNRRPPEHEPGKAIVPVSVTNGHGSKVPAPKYRNFFISFNALIDAFDEQINAYNVLCSEWQERNHRVDFCCEGDAVDSAQVLWASARDGAEQCAADLEQLWETRAKSQDLYHPSTEYLMWRIGEMLKGWDKLSDEVAADYAEHIAEHLVAKDLSVMVWESVFYDVEEDRKRKKPPLLGEVLDLMDKYKRHWERCLTAINQEKIKTMGEALVFTREFKNAVFKDAVLEYLDAHGHTELAAGVRDGELLEYYVAIEATARTEGLFELVAEMDTGGKMVNGRWQQTHPYEQAQRILTDKKRVQLEWDLLLKNAHRRVNDDKPFVCKECGAGYMPEQVPWHNERKEVSGDCLACGAFNSVRDHAIWEEKFAREQHILQQAFDAELQLWQREQKRREKLTRPPNEAVRLRRVRVREQRREERARQWGEEAREERRRRGEVECRGWEEERRRWGEEQWREFELSQQIEDSLFTREAIAMFENNAVPVLTPEEIAEHRQNVKLRALFLR